MKDIGFKSYNYYEKRSLKEVAKKYSFFMEKKDRI